MSQTEMPTETQLWKEGREIGSYFHADAMWHIIRWNGRTFYLVWGTDWIYEDFGTAFKENEV